MKDERSEGPSPTLEAVADGLVEVLSTENENLWNKLETAVDDLMRARSEVQSLREALGHAIEAIESVPARYLAPRGGWRGTTYLREALDGAGAGDKGVGP